MALNKPGHRPECFLAHMVFDPLGVVLGRAWLHPQTKQKVKNDLVSPLSKRC
jgi:hypothetical protein